jgi:YARHG domain
MAVSKDDMKQLLDEIRRQRPKESAPAPATKSSNNRDVSDDEAKWARVWASIERSTSEAVLSQFIVQAAGSIYADLARARLDEVRATAAASTSVRQPAPQSDNSTSASGGPGTWTPSSTCEKLWYQRNAVFYRYKYCFTGDKGRAVFGNAGCSRSQDQAWNAMSDSDRNAVNQIKDLERANAC